MPSRLKSRRGSASLYVLAALILISLFSALIVTVLKGDIYQMHAYELQMQAYYLSDEAASASVSALLADDDSSLLLTGRFPMSDTLTHTSEGKTLGVSSITMEKERHPYYGSDAVWVVIRIVTTIPDMRGSSTSGEFSYETTVMVLEENPLVRLYNIRPEDL